MSKIELNGKTLYHVIADTGYSDGAYSIFLLDERQPSRENIMKIYAQENGLDENSQEVKLYADTCDIYSVYTNEEQL